MKQLREFVEKNKDIPDSAPCIVERVTDIYFESREWHDGQITKGWDVLKVEGYHYHSSLEWNKKMQEEIDRRAKGEETEYDRLDNPEYAIYGEKS